MKEDTAPAAGCVILNIDLCIALRFSVTAGR